MDIDDDKHLLSDDEDVLATFDEDTFPGLDEDLLDEDEPLHIGTKVVDDEEIVEPEEIEL